MKFQWNKAANTLKDYKEIIRNWGQAVDSQGFTDKQVEVQMDSITRRMAKFKADLEGIWITGTNGGLTESLKETISALDGLLKLLNGIPHEIYAAAASFVEFLLAVKLAATVARIYSEQMLALRTRTGASTDATKKDTIEKEKNTVANEKNAVSAASAATATRGLAGAMTMAAGAGKMLATTVKGLFKSIPQAAAVWIVFEAVGKVVESLSDYDEAADKARQTTLDEYAAHEQSIMMGEKRVKFVDALLKAHGQLSAAIAETNDNDEKRKKIQEDIKVTEEELTNVLGKEAVERMKQDGWTEESKKRARDTYVRTIEDQKKSAKAMMLAEYNKAVETAKYAKAMIELYDREADAFIHGNNEKIKSLNWLRRAQVAFYDWMLGNAEDSLKTAEKTLEEANKNYNAVVERGGSEQERKLAAQDVFNANAYYKSVKRNYDEAKAKDEDARQEGFAATFGYNNEQNQKDLEAANQIMRGIEDPSKLIPDVNPPQDKVDGDGDDGNNFKKHLPNISQPNLSLIPQAESAKISAIKADLDALVKNTSEDLNRINQSIEMYGANDYTTEATRDVYLKQAKAYKDAANKMVEVSKSIRADLGAQLDGTAPIKASDIAQYASSAAGIRAAGVAANNYTEGQDWMGNVTTNPNIQCDSWTGDVYANAGIESIGGEATRNGTINSDNFKAAGAFHVLGDGYKPQPGDLISLDRSATSGHYGIVIDSEHVRSRDSSGGVTTWGLQDWIDHFSGQGEIGFGSIAEATGSEAAKFAQQFEVSNRSIEEAYNSAKETQGVWANLSKEERLAWADAHKDEIAEAKNFIALSKTMDSIEKSAADMMAKSAKAEYEAYKSVATNYEKQVAQAKQNVEYRNQQELANLGLGATDTDKARMAQETARAELAERQSLLTHKDKNGEVMLKKGTEGYKKWVYEIQKAQVALDESTEKLIEAQYNDSKSQYERLAKARDLAMGDMQDGMNWFNRYGEIQFNAMQDAEAEVERLHKKLDSLRNNTVTKSKKAIEETQNALTEAMQKAEKVRLAYHQKTMKGLHDIAEQMIFEGKNMSEIWQNMWTDFGKDSLKILMHQDVGEGSFLTQLIGMAKTNDDVNRLKSAQTETGQLSTDLANNASSIEQAQGIINNEQNIATITHGYLERIASNTANNGQFGFTENGAMTGVTAGQPNNYKFNQDDYSIENSIEQMGYQNKQLNLQTMKQTQAVKESTKATKDNTYGMGQAGLVMMSLAGVIGGLFGNSKGGRVASALLGGVGAYFGLRGRKDGGWFDNLPKFAKGGNTDGKIIGAGTGRSDSILAYLANKGKFVMLSNGEYVINEKSAKALGYETLDQLNHYANGGVLNPTPYVPTLNSKVVDSTLRNYGSGNGGLYRQNGTSIALMEKQNKMMAEQNDMLKNSNQQGSGQVIVLNTHASSDDVMRALQENPRVLQAILGRQNRMGFR